MRCDRFVVTAAWTAICVGYGGFAAAQTPPLGSSPGMVPATGSAPAAVVQQAQGGPTAAASAPAVSASKATPAASRVESQKKKPTASKSTTRHGSRANVNTSKAPERSSGCLSSRLTPAEQIQCFQADNAVMEAALKNAETRRKLDAMHDTRGLGLPSVLSTYGVGADRTAVLTWAGASGGALTVKAGDTVPGGWRVQSINDGKVVVRSPSGSVSTLLLESGVTGASNPSTSSRQMQATPAFGGTIYSAPPVPSAIPGLPAPRRNNPLSHPLI
jgi:hypothetical protein